MNSHFLPLLISNRSSGEKVIEYQANSSCVIMSVILMTTLFYKALISQEEIWCWSLLGLKGLIISPIVSFFPVFFFLLVVFSVFRYLAPFCWHNEDSCEKVACDHALPISLCCLSWEGGLDTFIYKIIGKKARILKYLYDWFRLDTVRLTRSPVLIDWTFGFDVLSFTYELSSQDIL